MPVERPVVVPYVKESHGQRDSGAYDAHAVLKLEGDAIVAYSSYQATPSVRLGPIKLADAKAAIAELEKD